MTDIATTEQFEGLDAVCRNVSQLISGADGPMLRMRVQVGEVAVEVEWPPSPGVPAPGASGAEAGVATDGADADPQGHQVCAPGVGAYFHAPEPGAEPFVKVGDRVARGQQIGILEVMKLMIPVEADAAGLVTEILTENGQQVEYGQPLISVEPE